MARETPQQRVEEIPTGRIVGRVMCEETGGLRGIGLAPPPRREVAREFVDQLGGAREARPRAFQNTMSTWVLAWTRPLTGSRRDRTPNCERPR